MINDEGGTAGGSRIHEAVFRVRGARLDSLPEQDVLAEETPVALEYNGIAYATMLATPADLEDFALGFSLTEGIVEDLAEIYELELESNQAGVIVRLEIASERFVRLKARRRALSGRTGCGLCGIESLAEALRPVPGVPQGGRVPLAAVLSAMHALRARQPLHEATGATHAAALAATDGSLLLVREDVGRHNALDKAIGAAARDGLLRTGDAAIALMSSRASFELVQKTAVSGIGVLAAVSAPTALAVRLAEEAGITLLGFVRGEGASVYSRADRLVTE
ncbi:MAG: formate dehydrogenase accessory sulfurtransferase FdhD [Tepidiphilus sp.]|jgi:FdhD protein|nr:formate dehydrogenase accessory sulfurtransferase FdhD [Tepidiphilus sp.]MDD3434000.1 formate dehydrogenase accessory sulfurtransferase FdhD [Tepidiphilus sp.]